MIRLETHHVQASQATGVYIFIILLALSVGNREAADVRVTDTYWC